MEPFLSRSCADSPVNVGAIAGFIASLQKTNGEIPWSADGKTDPWDHVESAMGLSMAGFISEAEKAYLWMAETQLSDGSWWSAIKNEAVEDKTRDSNFSSYIAVGLYHHYLITGEKFFLKRMWDTLERGINYAVGMQSDTGEIAWARNSEGKIDSMALLAGSSSVFMSLKCAIAVASLLGKRRSTWLSALEKLGEAIRHRPNLFNMIKARFAMDWYYPILCGAIQDREAKNRIDRSWEKFVVPGWGVRCVCDRPWATTAEGAELVISLSAIGEKERASVIFDWICDKKYDEGSYWMGVTFPDGIIWPEEKTSWTAAAVLLAYDALYGVTTAAGLFNHNFWKDNLHLGDGWKGKPA